MKEAYAVRRTVPPSAEIQASIDKLLAKGLVDDPQQMLSELGRLGARLIIQRAVEEEFDTWLGRHLRAGRDPVASRSSASCGGRGGRHRGHRAAPFASIRQRQANPLSLGDEHLSPREQRPAQRGT
jgi:hypothetical protein